MRRLFDQPADWTVRRVERVHFHDATTIRRSVSVDVELPRWPKPGDVAPVPLALLDKEWLLNFDLRDETGATQPLLTKAENGAIAAGVMRLEALRATDSYSLPGPVAHALYDLAVAGRGEWEEAHHGLQSALAQAGPPVADLAQHEGFQDLVRTFGRRFMLLVALGDGPRRRILKFSFDERYHHPGGLGAFIDEVLNLGAAQSVADGGPSLGWLRRYVLERVGWSDRAVAIRVPSLGESHSYHLEVTVPAGLKLTGLDVAARYPARFADPPAEDGDLDYWPGLVARSLGHVHVLDAPLGAEGLALVTMRASQRGWLPAAVATSALSAAVLAAGLWIIDALAASDVASVGIGLTSVAPGLALRPDEHELTAKVRFVRRLVLAGQTAIALLAAVFLLGAHDEPWLFSAWVVLAFTSWAGAAIMAATYVERWPWQDDE